MADKINKNRHRLSRVFKRALALFIIVIINFNSFSAVVSSNDGSAFITKAEFDALVNDFNSRIEDYEKSIDAKIDGAIAEYLAGLATSSLVQRTPICIGIYGASPTFHRGDNYSRTWHDTSNGIVWGAYNLRMITFNLLKQTDDSANGASLMIDDWIFPNSKFKLLFKLNFDNNEWIFDSLSEDAVINWKWVSNTPRYNVTGGSITNIYWAWVATTWYSGINPTSSSVSLGTRGTQYHSWWQDGSAPPHRNFNDVAVSSQPTWANNSWASPLKCQGGQWSEVDASTWRNVVSHLWVTNDNSAIEKKFDLSFDYVQYLGVEPMSTAEVTTSTVINDVQGDFSSPKFVKPNMTWIDVYPPALHGSYGNSSADMKSRTRLYPNDVKYVIQKSVGLNEDLKLSLWDSPLFDRVVGDASEISFDITLSNEAGYSDATLYFSKSKWANTNAKPADANILKVYKDSGGTPLNSISLTKGVTTNVTIKDLVNGDLLYFSVVPASGNKAKIASIENCFYKYEG